MLKSSKANEEEEELECLGSLNILKAPHLSQSKIMTSLSSHGQKAEERDTQSSRKIKVAVNNSVIGLDIHKGPNMNHNNPCLGLKSERKEQEVASRREQIKVCDVMDDDMITSPDTTRSSQRVRLVAGAPEKGKKCAHVFGRQLFEVATSKLSNHYLHSLVISNNSKRNKWVG